jgi:hypothetical protein
MANDDSPNLEAHTLTGPLSCKEILEFQYSSWYSRYKNVTFKCTIVKPPDPEFRKYLESDGIFIPKGAEDQ